MNNVFVLQHLHLLAGREEDIKFIGVYRSRESALAAVARLVSHPGFKEFPEVRQGCEDRVKGFYLDAYAMDVDHWTEGFVNL